jgi:cold shock CspA family protein
MDQEYGWIAAWDRPRGTGRIATDSGESFFFHWTEARDFGGDLDIDTPCRFEKGVYIHPVTGRSVAQALNVERLGPRYHEHDLLAERDQDGDLLEPIQTGVVHRYDPARGWGHIQAHDRRSRIFFHESNVAIKRSLRAGDEVLFRRAKGTDSNGAPRWEAVAVEEIKYHPVSALLTGQKSETEDTECHEEQQ